MLRRLRGVGLGPVFGFEIVTGARRGRGYAGRSAFVALLLVGLALFWGPSDRVYSSPGELALVGRDFFRAVVAIQMTVVLLAAPAATAGAICVDKSRGTLTHVFVTDLGDREIVLGKLGARLAPVLALMACGVPVFALCGLLGGADLAMALGAYLVTAGVAAVACTLALVLSIWARKPHQALLPAYALLGLWAGLYPAWASAWRGGGPWLDSIGRLLLASNPFGAALHPVIDPSGGGLVLQASFCGLASLVALGLAFAASRSLRRVVLGQVMRPARRERPSRIGRLVGLIPGPSLDGNPVLWREWHRKRPTRWTGRLWAAYAVAAGLASVLAIADYYTAPNVNRSLQFAAQVNAWGVSAGLLLLTISAASALAEERDRGSLDVIMTTPLSTAEILRGKWWGTMAIAPRLAIFPIWVAFALAIVSGQWSGPLLMIGSIAAYSAVITGLGLLVATLVPRLPRAVGTCVVLYVLASAGFGFLPLLLDQLHDLYVGRPPYWGAPRPDWSWAALASPYHGVLMATTHAGDLWEHLYRNRQWRPDGLTDSWESWAYLWIVVDAALAGSLVLATWWSFDRKLGRVVGRPRPGGRPSHPRDQARSSPALTAARGA